MNKKTVVSGCLFCLMFLYSVSVFSKETIQLVPGDNYYPFVSDDLPHRGWSVAVIKTVFAHLNKPVQIDTLPWGRGFKWTLEGKYKGTFPYVYSDERNVDFLYSDPINIISVKIFVSRDSDIQTFSDLHGKRLCLPMGYTISRTIGSLQEKLNLIVNRAADTKGCFGHVSKGWSDAGLINNHYSNTLIQKKFGVKDKYRILREEYDQVPLYFIVSRALPGAVQVMSEFNRGLSEIKNNGKFKAIEAEYLKILSGQ